MITVTLEQLARKMEKVKWHGRYFSALCPWLHQGVKEKGPSLLVYPDGFVCLSCGKRAALSTLVRKLQSTSEPLVSKKDRLGFNWDSDLEETALSSHETLVNYVEMHSYLKERGVYSRMMPNMLGWVNGYYTIPIYSKSDGFEGLVLRASPDTEERTSRRYLLPPAQIDLLYIPDWYTLNNEDKDIYLVFGIFDALSLATLKLPVISTTHGKRGLSDDLIDQLRDLGRNIIILPDLGEEMEAANLAKALGMCGSVKYLRYPEGMKDPSDFIQGKQGVLLLKQLAS